MKWRKRGMDFAPSKGKPSVANLATGGFLVLLREEGDYSAGRGFASPHTCSKDQLNPGPALRILYGDKTSQSANSGRLSSPGCSGPCMVGMTTRLLPSDSATWSPNPATVLMSNGVAEMTRLPGVMNGCASSTSLLRG